MKKIFSILPLTLFLCFSCAGSNGDSAYFQNGKINVISGSVRIKVEFVRRQYNPESLWLPPAEDSPQKDSADKAARIDLPTQNMQCEYYTLFAGESFGRRGEKCMITVAPANNDDAQIERNGKIYTISKKQITGLRFMFY